MGWTRLDAGTEQLRDYLDEFPKGANVMAAQIVAKLISLLASA